MTDPSDIDEATEKAWVALRDAMNALQGMGELGDGVPVVGRRLALRQMGDGLVLDGETGSLQQGKADEWHVALTDYDAPYRAVEAVVETLRHCDAETRATASAAIIRHLEQMALVPDGTPPYVPCPNPECGKMLAVRPDGGLPPHPLGLTGRDCPLGVQES